MFTRGHPSPQSPELFTIPKWLKASHKRIFSIFIKSTKAGSAFCMSMGSHFPTQGEMSLLRGLCQDPPHPTRAPFCPHPPLALGPSKRLPSFPDTMVCPTQGHLCLDSLQSKAHPCLKSSVFHCLSFSVWYIRPFTVQFSLVTQSCLTLWDSMNCSTPGFPVHHQLQEFTQTHVHWVNYAI